MKFSKDNVLVKAQNGVELVEYCSQAKDLPIDCAIAKFRDGCYPRKMNKNFHEMFFVLEGTCEIIFDDHVEILEAGDAFIMPVDTAHTIKAKHADILISCTPQFDINNVVFL